MGAKLSVNINKVATLRNSRGGDTPNVVQVALDCERFGAEGITVHPRPDERHIRYDDVRELAKVLTTEFNIEGNPKEPRFVELVLETLPTQVTLVPDAEGQLTSNHGWDTLQNKDYLTDIIALFKSRGIRTSIFVDPDVAMVKGAKAVGADRIELYTESYAEAYQKDGIKAVEAFVESASSAAVEGLGVNAGHDLNLYNLKYFADHVPNLLEVSIGHALIADALYYGLENTIQQYLRQLKDKE